MITLYAIPWYQCNLHCPHCNVVDKYSVDQGDYQKFKESLFYFKNTFPDSNIVFWGGEPLYYAHYFFDLMKTGVFSSVSSNLINYTYNVGEILARANVSVATSWNKTRFNHSQYLCWLNACKMLIEEHGVNPLLLITLTPDLVYSDPRDMVSTLSHIHRNTGIQSFLFEHFITDDAILARQINAQADDWLCAFFDNYQSMPRLTELPKDFRLIEKLRNWNCDCTQTFTLEPSGELRRGCPQLHDVFVPNECFTCELQGSCRPCRIQPACSYPKKFAAKLGIHLL